LVGITEKIGSTNQLIDEAIKQKDFFVMNAQMYLNKKMDICEDKI